MLQRGVSLITCVSKKDLYILLYTIRARPFVACSIVKIVGAS